MKKVAASGYFDPLHIGHIEYLKNAKKLGDYLVVIVNTDTAAQNKKGYSFMTVYERMEIIKSLRYVDEVFECIDNDETVSKSLEFIKPDIFAKGGDRTIDTIPLSELEVCKKHNIQIVTGLGAKVQSSRDLINKVLNKLINPNNIYEYMERDKNDT